MEIYVVRHTTPKVPKNTCYGQTDVDVTNTFNVESTVIQSKLQHLTINKVFCSPLQRCVILAKKLNPNYTTCNALLELNFGDWEMQAWDQINATELNQWMKDFVNICPKNGESYLTLHQRVGQFIKQVPHQSLLVTHAGVIRSILSTVTNTNLINSFSFNIPYGCVLKIDLSKQTFSYL